ncbi:hypothetical protein V5N11_013654 [Cardamine amara subsp. amara]|uniref:Uncharacterized protein n=1 Tax=Cardamine amara subsp. amara TaxID=228776 RepID=A0ABD0ZTM0_CARAN
MQEKEGLDKNNALIQSDTCFPVYCESMTVIICLLFSKSVDNFSGTKEEPPDLKVISSSCFARTGIGDVFMQHKKTIDYFRMIFEVGERVWTPMIDGSFHLTRKIINNAHRLDLRGKFPMMLLFDGSNLVLFVAGQTDLRTNPFQLGEDEVILGSTKELQEEMEAYEDEEIQQGAKDALEQLEPEQLVAEETKKKWISSTTTFDPGISRGSLELWRLYQVHIGHDTRSRKLVHGHMIYLHSFSLISVLSHWVFRVRFLMRLVAHMFIFAIA